MPTPERLGKYLIRRRLGAGAMGVVYEGFDPLIERSVAIKLIRQETFDSDQATELRTRLKREAQAAGRLAHPGIVSVFEYGEGEAGVEAFIAMEMVHGRELKAALDAGERFSTDATARILRGVLGALQHAHERGVVHRDIKPGNVFLLPDGGVKVADFGVARIEASDLTQTGAVIGTPSYMAPEQLLGHAVDGRADLFACGVLLYQLLTGERPFTGSIATVMQKVLNEDDRLDELKTQIFRELLTFMLFRSVARARLSRRRKRSHRSMNRSMLSSDAPLLRGGSNMRMVFMRLPMEPSGFGNMLLVK